jgi:5'-nucleotidase
MQKILVTNDDGIDSDGIKILAESLAQIAEIVVVAPSTDMTAVSHSLTLYRPLRVDQRSSNHFTVDGTPTDCVLLGVNLVMKESPPALVVSGINKGANLGDDVHYSGTVAGAVEGSLLGIPSIAVSLVGREPYDFSYAAKFAALIAAKVLNEGLPRGTLLNVNVPRGPVKGAEITKQGTKIARTKIIEGVDPRKRRYYWIGQEFESWDQQADTDFLAVRKGLVSITPLKNDMTHHALLPELARWDEEWLRVDSQELLKLEDNLKDE